MQTLQQKHGLTFSAVEDIATLINTLNGSNIVPASKFLLKKSFKKQDIETHYFWADCFTYIGKTDSDMCSCSYCGSMYRCNFKKLNEAYFMYMPIKTHFRPC